MTQTKQRSVRALCLLATLALLIGAFALLGPAVRAEAVTQSEIDALKAKRQTLADEKNAKSVEIKLLQDEQASVTAQKAALDEQNELTRQEIELINEQIELYSRLIEEKEIELQGAIAEEQSQILAYKKHLRAMEERGPITYLEILFQAVVCLQGMDQLQSKVLDYVLEFIDERKYFLFTICPGSHQEIGFWKLPFLRIIIFVNISLKCPDVLF